MYDDFWEEMQWGVTLVNVSNKYQGGKLLSLPFCKSHQKWQKCAGIQNFLNKVFNKQFQWEYFYHGANLTVKS